MIRLIVVAVAFLAAPLAGAHAGDFDGVWLGKLATTDIKLVVKGTTAELTLQCVHSSATTTPSSWKLPITSAGVIDAWANQQHYFARRHVRAQLPTISLEGSGLCGSGKTRLTRTQ